MNEIKISNEEFDRVKYSRLPTNPSARTKYGDSEYRGESLKKRMDEPFELFKAKFNALVSLIGGNEQGDNLLKHIPTGITDTHTLLDLIADIVSDGAEFASYLSVGERTLLEELEKINNTIESEVGARGAAEGAEVFNDYDDNVASGEYSHVEGTLYTPSGEYSGELQKNIASGFASHAEGGSTIASGDYAHAEGRAEIDDTTKEIIPVEASGKASHAEGGGTKAKRHYSHSEGNQTQAIAAYSHAEGWHSVAGEEDNTLLGLGHSSHAEGYYTKSLGSASHAEGDCTEAWCTGSHAEGWKTIANCKYQHVQGRYNVKDENNEYAHIIGGGWDSDNRINIHTVDWSGNAWYQGTVKAGGAVEDDDLVNKKYVDGKSTFVVSLTSSAYSTDLTACSIPTKLFLEIAQKIESGCACIIKVVSPSSMRLYMVNGVDIPSTLGVEKSWSTSILCSGLSYPDKDRRYILSYREPTCIVRLDDHMDKLEAIAKGRSTGYVFDTKDDMETWLSYAYKYIFSDTKKPCFTGGYELTDDLDLRNRTLVTLMLGDNLYIRDTGVPDYWWDGNSAQQLETQKVDLDGFADKEYVDGAIGGIESVLDGIIAIQNSLIGGNA